MALASSGRGVTNVSDAEVNDGCDWELSTMLEGFAPHVTTGAEAVRWACLLEATAPKVGNVSPGQSFADLRYEDFVIAAEVAADAFRDCERFSDAILRAVKETGDRCGTNVNLGILLLLGPLHLADQKLLQASTASPSDTDWCEALDEVLNSLDSDDQLAIFHAISVSSAGGMGKVERWDVNEAPSDLDLIQAMSAAAERDRIAKQYDTGFRDFFENYVPVLRTCLLETRDLLRGIVYAQIELLANFPDSLIARKNGDEAAEEVRRLAARTTIKDPEQVNLLDSHLRADGNRLNPGTTADLIAAALFVIFRSLPRARLARCGDGGLGKVERK